MEAGIRTLFAALLALLALPGHGAESCQLARLAEWPVRLVRGLPVVEGAINGRKAGIMLDTGAYATLITKDAAQRLDLWTRATGEVAAGVGGESRVLWTRVHELRIGDATVPDMRVRVIGERPIPGVDFILGDDFFRAVDLEFDYAHGVVRVYKPSPGCERSWLAYWDPGAVQVPLENDRGIVLPVKVNGREVFAMLDSGASSSVVSLAVAEKAGLRTDTPGLVPSSCSGGLGADFQRNWVGTFEALAFGQETIRDARLRVMDFSDISSSRTHAPDMLLGTDFLRTHRVFASRHQAKLYFTYAGGLVFPATPDLDCDEGLRGKGVAEARAAYDRALEKDPGDLKARLNRGAVRIRQGDAKGALEDLDMVLRATPDNAVALRERMAARRMLEDYDGALEDSAAAIANGMRVPDMYVARALLRAAKGDLAGAIAECDEALKLDPRHATALRIRGRYLFHAGRFEESERDFAARLVVRNAFDPIWISLARGRRGVEGEAVLRQWLASGDGAWPEPVMRHLLGGLDLDALMAAAAAAEEPKRKGQVCEARFYAAERLVVAGKAAAARPLLEAAREECPRNFMEYESAGLELARPP